MTTEVNPDDDVENAAYDGAMASKIRRARAGKVSPVRLALLAGDAHCIKRRYTHGVDAGYTYHDAHSTARPSLAACLFTTSHSNLRRRAQADTATCDMLYSLRTSQKQKSALPHGGPGFLYSCSGLHYSGLWRVGAPDRGCLPPIRDSHDQMVTIWEPTPTALDGT